MKKVCAWCNKIIGYVDSEDDGDHIITHGICEDCAAKIESESGIPFSDFLDSIEAPVILMAGSSSRIIAANKTAYKLLKKKPGTLKDKSFGDAIECSYAHSPKGCGREYHCRSCAIRLSVMETYSTGKSRLKVKAYADLDLFHETKKIKYVISTEKIKKFVLLRIDEIIQEKIKK